MFFKYGVSCEFIHCIKKNIRLFCPLMCEKDRNGPGNEGYLSFHRRENATCNMANPMNDYPLNCIDNLSDGFSGWFAISNPRKCNDFCYWHHEPLQADSENEDENNAVTDDDENNDDDDRSSSQYTAWNTANPHKTTIIEKSEKSRQSAYWVCVYDAADDSVLASQAEGKSWVDTWQKYIPMDDSLIGDDGVPFPFLRCQKVSRFLISLF